MEAEWIAQLQPRNLLERLYVEKIAAASWRLRRLNRWQAQLFEDETLTEDERLNKLDKVLRHETALHRQIDTSVKMLNKDVPQLYKGRARDRALLDTMQTEMDCREDRENALEVEFEARERLKAMEAVDRRPDPGPVPPGRAQQNCQNEPASLSSSSNPLSTSQPTPPVSGGVAHVCPPGSQCCAGVGSSDMAPDCQNEPAPASSCSDSPSLTGRGGEPKASRGGSLGVLTISPTGRIRGC